MSPRPVPMNRIATMDWVGSRRFRLFAIGARRMSPGRGWGAQKGCIVLATRGRGSASGNVFAYGPQPAQGRPISPLESTSHTSNVVKWAFEIPIRFDRRRGSVGGRDADTSHPSFWPLGSLEIPPKVVKIENFNPWRSLTFRSSIPRRPARSPRAGHSPSVCSQRNAW